MVASLVELLHILGFDQELHGTITRLVNQQLEDVISEKVKSSY